MLKKASEVIASGNVGSVVDFAIEANREVASSQRELDAAKAYLRGRALAQRVGRQDLVELEGHLGLASVAFSPDTAKAKKGKDLKDLEANLSPGTFALLFTKMIVITPVKELPELLGTLEEAERLVVERFLEVKPTTPKVFLTQ